MISSVAKQRTLIAPPPCRRVRRDDARDPKLPDQLDDRFGTEVGERMRWRHRTL